MSSKQPTLANFFSNASKPTPKKDLGAKLANTKPRHKVVDVDGDEDKSNLKRKQETDGPVGSPKRAKLNPGVNTGHTTKPTSPLRKVRPSPPTEPSPPRSPRGTPSPNKSPIGSSSGKKSPSKNVGELKNEPTPTTIKPVAPETPTPTQRSSSTSPGGLSESPPASRLDTPSPRLTATLTDAKPKIESSDAKKANARRWFAGGKGGHNTGAKNPGSKDLPLGDPKCLEGKSFVITGQLDSLDRSEAEDFICRHGGLVRTSVSAKTSYLVVGEEPGQSKLEKAKKVNTKQLAEDQLIELVVEVSQRMGVDAWAWKGGASQVVDDDMEADVVPALQTAPQLPQPAANVTSASSAPLSNLLPSPNSTSSFYGTATHLPDKTPVLQHTSVPTPPVWQPPAIPMQSVDDQLWADKYRPQTTKEGMVVPPQAGELRKWLLSWADNLSKPLSARKDWKKAALLSGSPGIGKTTSAHLIGSECGYEVVEWNASDKRSKKDIQETILDMVNNTSVKGLFQKSIIKQKKCCIVMDEVDGCDRGGVGEVIQMIHRTKVPIICICNDRFHPKVKSLANHCLDLKFHKPNRSQVASHLQKLIRKEGHDMPLPTLEHLVTSMNNDIRNLLNSLQMWFKTRKNISHDEARGLEASSNKDHDVSMFEAPELFLTPQNPKLSIEKMRQIYFTVEFVPLYVQENYLNMRPQQNCNTMDDRLDLISRAADSISMGDISETFIRRHQNWGLSSVGVFQSAIYPSSLVRGKFEPLKPPTGWMDNRLRFPSWLGQNSARKKTDRMVSCIAKAARNPVSGATGTSAELRLHYFNLFTHYTTKPFVL
jgi:replication factor C subunit 1